MRVNTDVWILPPLRALWIPPGMPHQMTTLSKASVRSIYVDASPAAPFGSACRVIEMSSLLRELILALGAEPADYPLAACRT